VSPSKTTTYEVRASNGRTTARAQVTLVVVPEKRHDDGGDGSGTFFVLEDELAERAHVGGAIVRAAESPFRE
jgi:hypothetical protein